MCPKLQSMFSVWSLICELPVRLQRFLLDTSLFMGQNHDRESVGLILPGSISVLLEGWHLFYRIF